MLGYDEETIRREIEAGELKAYRLRHGAPWRVDYVQVRAYAQRIGAIGHERPHG
jgi:hypothetical protein